MQNKRIMQRNGYEKKGFIRSHIENNLRNYVIITVFFLVGLIIGVLYINNTNVNQQEEISTYINEFINNAKNDASIDYTSIFITSVKNNLLLALFLWFSGLTVIGIFALYGIICFRGFSFRI